MSAVSRVAITGYMHEVNAFADPITLGHGLQTGRHGGWTRAHLGGQPASHRLRELRSVEFVELPVWEFGASGPLIDGDFRGGRATGGRRRCARPARSTGCSCWATVPAAPRSTSTPTPRSFAPCVGVVGDDVPVVMVLDFHANVSPAMCDLADVVDRLPHQPARRHRRPHCVEAAEQLHRMLDGERTSVALCRPPMVLPQIAQTHHARRTARRRARRGPRRASAVPVRNVSRVRRVLAGRRARLRRLGRASPPTPVHAHRRPRRSRSTSPGWPGSCATATGCTARRSPTAVAEAARASHEVTAAGHPGRHGRQPRRRRPGQHARSCWRALLDGRRERRGDGSALRPAPSSTPHGTRASGATVRVEFNAGSERPFAAPARRRGHGAGARGDGAAGAARGCLRRHATATRVGAVRCDIGGIRIAVSSHKVQCADDDTLRHVGLDPAAAKVVVVKSARSLPCRVRPPVRAATRSSRSARPAWPPPSSTPSDWQHLPRPCSRSTTVDRLGARRAPASVRRSAT